MKRETRLIIIVYAILLVLGISEGLLIYGIHNYLGRPILLENPARSAAR